MRMKEFADTWNELSPIQQEAAEWNEGPLLVLAGPGSGKTRVLTCRIARILEATADQNFRILGLTFTNKAADEMRSRLAKFIPDQQRRLFIGTFHAFCADVLRQHGIHLKINPNFQIYSENADLQAILNDAVEKAKRQYDFISDLDKKTLPVIHRLKSLLIQPTQCRHLFKDAEFGERMSVVYPEYEAELSFRNALDFDSLIFKVHELFTSYPVFAKRYRTVYPYICIDEFQDTNQAQYALIQALTKTPSSNLFMVADDDQIIYQWNGASHQRIQEFVTDYAPKVIQLPINYRCPPEIVRLANNLISHNFLRQSDKAPIQSALRIRDDATVRLLGPYPNFEAEAENIVKDILALHAKHLNSVVVLGRNRRLLEVVQKAAVNAGVNAVILQRKNDFTSTPFIWLNAMLRLANDRQNEKYLEAVSGSFSQLVPGLRIDIAEIMALAQASNRDYLQHWLQYLLNENIEAEIKTLLDQTLIYLAEGRNFQNFVQLALSWFKTIDRSSSQKTEGMNAEIFANYKAEAVVWQDLTREIKSGFGERITLASFLQELQLRSKESTPDPETLSLLTIHGAKGKEYDHVYLIGLVEDERPSFQSKQKGERSPEMEEERRNCFVAITRARRTLTLSYALIYRNWPKTPSRFLSEMGLK